MKPIKKFSEIIDRIEYLRNLLKLNKSRFSSEIGMKPQTYNNFIGAQGSKPNLELITGIVNTFGVNPLWLLNGNGPIFLDEQKASSYRGLLQHGLADLGEGRADYPMAADPDAMGALREELKDLEPLLENVESRIKTLEHVYQPIVDRYVGVIKRYYELDPVSAVEEVKEMLKRVEVRLGKEEQNNSAGS